MRHATILCIFLCLIVDVPARLQVLRTAVRPAMKMQVALVDAISDSNKQKMVEVHNFPGNLRGMKARVVIDNSAPIMTVPSTHAIEVTNYRQPTPLPDLVPDHIWRASHWYKRIAFKLLNERSSAAGQGKYGWIDKLPKQFNTPIHWTDEEILELQYPLLVANINKQRIEWRAFYDTWQQSYSGVGNAYSYEDLEWAMECAHSRAFSGPYEGSTAQQRIVLLLFTALLTVCWPLLQLGSMEQSASLATIATLSMFLRDYVTFKSGAFKRYVLCPGIDMFNHNSSCVSDVSYNYFSDAFELRILSAGKASVDPVAGSVGTDKQLNIQRPTQSTSYQAGEQVFINYGAQSNDRFLQYYGFVEQDNPHDVYDFGVSPVELILKYADRMHNVALDQDLHSACMGMTLCIPTDPSPDVRLKTIASVLSTAAHPDAEKVHQQSSGTVRYHARAPPVGKHSDLHTASEGSSILAHFDVLTVAALRALCCTPQEWNKLFATAQVPEGTDSQFGSLILCQQPLSATTEGNVAAALRTMVYLELRDKPTTLQEDITALAAPSTHPSAAAGVSRDNDRSRLYLQFRIEKKKLLHAALQQ